MKTKSFYYLENLTTNEVTTPIIPSLSPDISKQNQLEIIPIIAKLDFIFY